MEKEQQELKSFNMRMPREIWLYLKKTSADQDISMGDFIIFCVNRYRKSLNIDLTLD